MARPSGWGLEVGLVLLGVGAGLGLVGLGIVGGKI